jgi:ACS family hexuronate transporter-like MFS transporter
VGTATGVAGMAANLGVLIFTLALGSLVDQVGYQPFFIFSASSISSAPSCSGR